jgi:hypothetical protein
MLAGRLARRGVVLSAGSLAAALSPGAASAGLAGALVSATVKGAILFAAGRAAGGVISAHVATLAEGVLKAMVLTKVKLTTVVFLTLGLLFAGAAVSTHALTAAPEVPRPAGPTTADRPARADNPPGKQPGDRAAQDARLQALLKERLAILRDMAATLKEQYKSGVASHEMVQQAELRVSRAELDLCETDKERVAVHEKIVDIMKENEKRIAQLRKAGAVSEGEMAETKLKRLDAEIDLERARTKAASPSK